MLLRLQNHLSTVTSSTWRALPSTPCSTWRPPSSASYSAELKTESWSELTTAGPPCSPKARETHSQTPAAPMSEASLQPTTQREYQSIAQVGYMWDLPIGT